MGSIVSAVVPAHSSFRTFIHYEDVVLPVQEVPLWKQDGRKIVFISTMRWFPYGPVNVRHPNMHAMHVWTGELIGITTWNQCRANALSKPILTCHQEGIIKSIND